MSPKPEEVKEVDRSTGGSDSRMSSATQTPPPLNEADLPLFEHGLKVKVEKIKSITKILQEADHSKKEPNKYNISKELKNLFKDFKSEDIKPFAEKLRSEENVLSEKERMLLIKFLSSRSYSDHLTDIQRTFLLELLPTSSEEWEAIIEKEPAFPFHVCIFSQITFEQLYERGLSKPEDQPPDLEPKPRLKRAAVRQSNTRKLPKKAQDDLRSMGIDPDCVGQPEELK